MKNFRLFPLFVPQKINKKYIHLSMCVSRENMCTYSSLDVAFLVAVFQVKKMYT